MYILRVFTEHSIPIVASIASVTVLTLAFYIYRRFNTRGRSVFKRASVGSSLNGPKKLKKKKKKDVLVLAAPQSEPEQPLPVMNENTEESSYVNALGSPDRVASSDNLFLPVQLPVDESDDTTARNIAPVALTSSYGAFADEEEERAFAPVVELGRPQGYENVDSSTLLNNGPLTMSTSSAYEALDRLGSAEGMGQQVYAGGMEDEDDKQQQQNFRTSSGVYEDFGSNTGNPISGPEWRNSMFDSKDLFRPGDGGTIDWNAMFQGILELPEDNEVQISQKYERLSSLAHDFVETAQRIGTMIISEAFLDPKCKTILPCNIGGEAGGEKWKHMGILFKFAVDWKRFYGGDARAMKSAGHELKSLMRYYLCEGISVPLMALIDYRGFRLVAQSILPISSKTIIYGSNDGGRTVHNTSADFAKKMELAGKQLNIKGHMCGVKPGGGSNHQALLFGPTDIEGHLGLDGRQYVIDLARVFPPTCEDGSVKETFLYKLMRPEWVAQNAVPLSSDACSGFSSFRMDSVENREVFESTQRLLTVRVPEFAAWLDEAMKHTSFARKAHATVTEELHRQGINCRYFGLVRSHCRTDEARNLLLVEIVARVVKNILRERLRSLARSLNVPGEMPYRKAIVATLNMVLGHNGAESQVFWEAELRRQIGLQFKGTLSKEEESIAYDLRSKVSLYRMLKRLQRLAAMTLSKQSLSELKKSPDHFHVVLPDIERISSQVKHMNIVSYAEGMSLYLASKLESGPGGRRLFRLAESKFDSAVRSTPDNVSTLNTYADVLRDHAARVLDEDSLALYTKAMEKYYMARNWASLTSLGHHLLDVYSRHWRCQDAVLSLAYKCFESVSLVPGAPGDVSRRSLARVLVTRAALRFDMEMYAESGRMFASDLATLGLTPEDTRWLSKLSHTDLAALSEVLSNSPALTEFDVRWITNAPMNASVELLSGIWANARCLETLIIDFGSEFSGLIMADEEVRPAVLTGTTATSLKSMFDGTWSDKTVAQIVSYPCATKSLKKLVVHRQTSVTDEGFAALIRRCPSVTDLSLEGCSEVGRLTFAAIGSSCPHLLRLNLNGTGKGGPLTPEDTAPLAASFKHMQHLNLGRTSWTSAQYVQLLRQCEASLTHLDVSSCMKLNEMFFDQVQRMVVLETFVLEKCAYLADKLLSIFLPGSLSQLANINLAYCSEIRDATLSSFLLAGGNGQSAKGGWRSNLLRTLNLAQCNNVSDSSLQLLRNVFLEIDSLNFTACRVSDQLVCDIIPQASDRLKVLDLTDVRSGRTDSILETLGKGYPALSVLRVGSTSEFNESVTDEGIAMMAAGCPNLKELSLLRCREVGDKGMESLSRGCPLLEKLNLSYCNFITSVGVNHLADRCHNMVELRMAHCKLLGEIYKVSVGMPKLKTLDLHECTHVADEAIVRIVNNIHSLEFLDVVNCRKVTDRSLKAIQAHAPRMLAVALGGANKISDPALNDLRNSRPKMVIYLFGASAAATERAAMSTSANNHHTSSNNNNNTPTSSRSKARAASGPSPSSTTSTPTSSHRRRKH